MLKWKKSILIILVICILVTGATVYFLGGIDRQQMQNWLKQLGVWAPVIYIFLYTLGTLLILPSTPLNITGGVVFGAWWGTLWTSIAAVIAAIVSFTFTRTIGRGIIAQKLQGHWEAMDAEMRQGGLFYMFAIRLLPLIPYGIVNFAAGLTSIRFRDYFLGTLLGTIPGILPFVMMGSGVWALQSGDLLPITFAFALTGILIGGATWYRRRRQSLKEKLQNRDKLP